MERMIVLMTGGNSPLARAVASELSGEYQFRLADRRLDAPLPPGAESFAGDPCDAGFIQETVSGVDAILHLSPVFPIASSESDALDQAARGTFALLKAAGEAGVRRFVLGSSLDLFEKLPSHWRVTESWKPRPQPVIEQLGPWLAELSLREFARLGSLDATVLRFGRIVAGDEIARLPFDSRWLGLEDAVHAVRRALSYHPEIQPGWRVFHIAAPGSGTKVRIARAGREPFDYRPSREFARPEASPAESGSDRLWRAAFAPSRPIPSRPLRNVVIFGAGGPLGTVVAEELSSSYALRLTDLRTLEEVAALPPQSPGAPLPSPARPPHEFRQVDVTDLGQVMAACEGMDAVINCSVVREDPVQAFRVNALGAYHVMRAAVAHGIRRAVQTGPQLIDVWRGDYEWDFDIPSDAPPRATGHLYSHSKYLGQEICRAFAEEYDLEIPVLLFTAFVNPEVARPGHLHPFSVTWEDSARAVRRALEVVTLPSPYEVFNILADLPHGRYDNRKAKEILDWRPRDDMERLWTEES
jgi:nucleoside-diphosphate-sugar epimerase